MKNSILIILMVPVLININCKAKTNQAKARLGEKAPPFTLHNYDGNDINLSDCFGFRLRRNALAMTGVTPLCRPAYVST